MVWLLIITFPGTNIQPAIIEFPTEEYCHWGSDQFILLHGPYTGAVIKCYEVPGPSKSA
jgi:hypothetical protein